MLYENTKIPSSICPHPATSTLGPWAQTPQQSVLQSGGSAIGRTLGKPSSG